jgi:hypothetical protein
MKTIKTIALAAMCLMSAAGGSAQAAVSLPAARAFSQTADIQRAGYFLPNGVYIVTCHSWVVGYNAWGRPIWRRVCG